MRTLVALTVLSLVSPGHVGTVPSPATGDSRTAASPANSPFGRSGEVVVPAADGSWPQWGGPNRDFVVADAGLAREWPENGPPELWRRPLGEGYSGIAVADGHLYTLFRRGGEEVVVALREDSGETVWEHAYPASTSSLNTEYGPGPHTTPLVVGDRLFTVGALGSLRALDRADGSLLWSVELWDQRGGTVRDRGYSSSPMAHGDTVLCLVGGPDRAVVAFARDDGSIAWSGGDFDNGHASPIVIQVDGREQVVAFVADGVAGIETGSGRTLWSVEHPTNWGLNIATPVWDPSGVLFVSSAYSGGSRAIRLSGSDAGTEAEELFFTSRMRVHFGTILLRDGIAYGSSGDFGPAFFTALDTHSGEVVWRDRGFGKASFVTAGDTLVLLDEDGNLALAELGEGTLRVLEQTALFDSLAWTVPTLAGTKLFARNRREIVAVDLSGPGAP